MDLHVVPIDKPEEVNLILGQAHFIKTVDDLHETLAQASPVLRFGVAFCESSGPRLIRRSGNDQELVELGVAAARELAAGHCFVILLREGFPISVLNGQPPRRPRAHSSPCLPWRSPSTPAVWPTRSRDAIPPEGNPWPFIPLPRGRTARATARPSGHDLGAAPADGIAETSQGMERVTVAVAPQPPPSHDGAIHPRQPAHRPPPRRVPL